LLHEELRSKARENRKAAESVSGGED